MDDTVARVIEATLELKRMLGLAVDRYVSQLRRTEARASVPVDAQGRTAADRSAERAGSEPASLSQEVVGPRCTVCGGRNGMGHHSCAPTAPGNEHGGVVLMGSDHPKAGTPLSTLISKEVAAARDFLDRRDVRPDLYGSAETRTADLDQLQPELERRGPARETMDEWKNRCPRGVEGGRHVVIDAVIHVNEPDNVARAAASLSELAAWLAERPTS